MISANISKAKRKAIYRRDGFRCALCDSTNGLQVHHIIPRGEGGTDNMANLICLCWKCHAAAHGVKIEDYPPEINADTITQACIEYISDWYAEVLGKPWSPWERD